MKAIAVKTRIHEDGAGTPDGGGGAARMLMAQLLVAIVLAESVTLPV